MEKITLVEFESLLTHENLLVMKGGEYDPIELVEVCDREDKTLALCAYQAHYIKHGVNFSE